MGQSSLGEAAAEEKPVTFPMARGGPEARAAAVQTSITRMNLRQEMDGLQVRHLQPASCLYFKIEITTGTG